MLMGDGHQGTRFFDQSTCKTWQHKNSHRIVLWQGGLLWVKDDPPPELQLEVEADWDQEDKSSGRQKYSQLHCSNAPETRG